MSLSAIQLPTGPEEALLGRARRHRRRGEHRRAMLVLREACHRAHDDARLWTLYAISCVRLGRQDDAIEALSRAAWLRAKNREDSRARVTRDLAERILAGDFRVAA